MHCVDPYWPSTDFDRSRYQTLNLLFCWSWVMANFESFFIYSHFEKCVYSFLGNILLDLNSYGWCFAFLQQVLNIFDLNHIIMSGVWSCGNSTFLQFLIEHIRSETSCRLTVTDQQSFNYFLWVKSTVNVALTPRLVYRTILAYSVSRKLTITSQAGNESFWTNIFNKFPSSFF